MKQSFSATPRPDIRQVEIDFEAGLPERFPDFMDCVRASVYGSRRQLKAVAADMDLSSSELSRRLADNPNDPIYLPTHRLPDLIRATGDVSPIYWLIETFLDQPEAKRRRAVAQLSELLPRLESLLAQAAEGM